MRTSRVFAQTVTYITMYYDYALLSDKTCLPVQESNITAGLFINYTPCWHRYMYIVALLIDSILHASDG